jgi:ParB family protein of integrating conjugative element (PFGI_1 class)
VAGQKTPVTLSAAERQAQLTREGKIPPAPEAAAGTRPSYTSDEVRARLNAGRQEDFAAAAARNLVPEHRFPRAAAGLKPDDEFDGATMTLESSKIKPYDRNPRRSINPNYEEIKEAIKVKGVLNQITVTRRPGMPEYMVYGGGNTRLKVVQELDIEYPGNALYSHMKVVYRSWRGESDVIAAHLIENEARGDTTFWDKANGLLSLKKELETELGTTLSSNDVRIKAVALGWKVSRDIVQLYDFAVDSLSAIGPWLKFNGARQIKERIGALSAAMRQLDVH